MQFITKLTWLLLVWSIWTFDASSGESCACGQPKEDGAGYVEFPWQAALILTKTGMVICSASIITNRAALTAAHCTYWVPEMKSGEMKLGVGSTTLVGMKQYPLKKKVEQDYYNPLTNNNDVALLFTEEDIDEAHYGSPVCLPNWKYHLEGEVQVLGWIPMVNGTMVKSTTLNVLSRADCKEHALGSDSRKFCTVAFGEESCWTPLGGPVVQLDEETSNIVQVGIASYALRCVRAVPQLNTAIIKYLRWIQERVEGETKTQPCYNGAEFVKKEYRLHRGEKEYVGKTFSKDGGGRFSRDFRRNIVSKPQGIVGGQDMNSGGGRGGLGRMDAGPSGGVEKDPSGK